MNNYEILLNEINQYLNSEEINKDNYIISLYDLLKIIDNETSDYRNITKNSLLLKKLRFASKLSPLVNECSISVDGCSDNAQIKFIEKLSYSEPFYIYKDRNIDDVYFGKYYYENKKSDFFKKIVKKNYDTILETFQIIEEYIDLLGKIQYFESTFTDNLFETQIKIHRNGEVRLDLSINKNHPLYEEYSKKWNQKESICDYVERHKIEILKRFLVVTRNLEEPLSKIYYKSKENTKVQTKKVKTIRKISC